MKYIKIHSSYLLNKVNIIILSVITIAGIITGYLSICNLTSNSCYFYLNDSYLDFVESNLIFFKLILINMFAYIWGNAFNRNFDSYHLLINNYKNNKFKFFITKILLLTLVTFIIMYIIFLITSIIGLNLTNWFEVNNYTIDIYFTFFLIIIIYCLISIIFSNIIPSNYSFFLSPILFVIGELIKDNNSIELFNNIYKIFFPSLTEYGSTSSLYGNIHLLLLVFIYMFISFLTYSIKKK